MTLLRYAKRGTGASPVQFAAQPLFRSAAGRGQRMGEAPLPRGNV